MHLIDGFLTLPYANTTIEIFVKPLNNFLHNVLFCLGEAFLVSFYTCKVESIRYLSVGPLGEGVSASSLNDLGNTYVHIIKQQKLGSIRLLAYMIEEVHSMFGIHGVLLEIDY